MTQAAMSMDRAQSHPRPSAQPASGGAASVEPANDVLRYRAVAIFADDLQEWRCEFSATADTLSSGPAKIVERLFQALLASGQMGAEQAPEINFAIAHESSHTLTASGRANRPSGPSVPFVILITKVYTNA